MNPWKQVCALIALTVLLFGCKETEVPSEVSQGQLVFRVINSLAIPNHEVGIEISRDQITVTRHDNNKKTIESSGLLSPEELASIWRAVDSIDWKNVDEDDVLGLGGTSYFVRFSEREYEVWTPENDTEARGLSSLLELKSLLWT